MPLRIELDEWDGLFDRFAQLKQGVEAEGERIVRKTGAEVDRYIQDHLSHQGRGGAPPPLSSATLNIYGVDGEPDGSGLRNHIKLTYHKTATGTIAVIGIPEGKPTVIAHVQNSGAVIPVTPKMRGFLAAAYGIYLKAETQHIHIPGRHFWDQAMIHGKNVFEREFSTFFARVLS